MKARTDRGFTLIELLLVLALIAIVGVLIVPSIVSMFRQITVNRVQSDIQTISVELETFEQREGRWPMNLDELPGGPYIDPWGNPYRYLPPTSPDWSTERRWDRFLAPLNTDFDLYSLGPDGESRPPLTSSFSWDDIVRANDGLFIGPANEF